MARKGTKKNRTATSCAHRDLQSVLSASQRRIDEHVSYIKELERDIQWYTSSLKDAKSALEQLKNKHEQSKETILKNASKVKIKVGQAIHHKKYGNCLVKDLRLTRTGKSVQAVLTGVEGGTYTVPHNQCIPFQDMTTAIFG